MGHASDGSGGTGSVPTVGYADIFTLFASLSTWAILSDMLWLLWALTAWPPTSDA